MKALNDKLFGHNHAPVLLTNSTKGIKGIKGIKGRKRIDVNTTALSSSGSAPKGTSRPNSSALKPTASVSSTHSAAAASSSSSSYNRQHPYRLWLSEDMNQTQQKDRLASTAELNKPAATTSKYSRSTPALTSMIIDDDDVSPCLFPHQTKPEPIAEEEPSSSPARASVAPTATATARPFAVPAPPLDSVTAADMTQADMPPAVTASNTALSPKPTPVSPRPPVHSSQPTIITMAATEPATTSNPHTAQEPLPRTAEEWREKGAASAVRQEADAKGQVRTVVIKKGVKDFEFGKTLGTGSYSTVVCGSDKQTLRQYAIKILDKRHIIKEKKVKYVEIEKRTLNRLGDHPGIIPLYYTFQDEDSLYFVLDFAANGELLTLIKRLGSLSEDCVKYYGAQLLDAVQFMHSRGVLHRDLKPENILLDDKMRIKVTDFGTAKLLNREKDANGKELESYPQDVRASSFVGTAEYVSPELLVDKYVTKSCDVWAYGCILYQMIAGRPPFKGKNEYQTFQKIVKLQFSYPPHFPTVIRDLIKHILVLNPDRRYSTLQIRQHQFYQGIEWSRQSIWRTPHPRLLPYRPTPRHASNPMNIISSRSSAPSTPSVNVPSGAANGANGPYFSRPRPGQSSNGNTTPSAAAAAVTAPGARVSSSPNLIANNLQQQHNNAHPTHAANANQAIFSAAAGAAAALAKPVSTISPYRTPTQPPSSANYRERVVSDRQASASAPAPAPSQPRTIPRVAVNTSRPGTTAQDRQPPSPAYQQQQPIHNGAPPTTSSAVPPNQPASTAPPPPAASVAATPQSHHFTQPSSTTTSKTASRVKPLEIPPLSNVDRELKQLLVQKDERVLKIGNVIMSVTNSNNTAHPSSPYAEVHNQMMRSTGNLLDTNGRSKEGSSGDEDVEDQNEKEPSRISRLFTGNRKKKRIMFVTTAGRLVVITSLEDLRKVHLDLRVVAPQVALRELAHNRKTNVGMFLVEAHNKVFTFEDPAGSAEWIAAINKARLYVENAEAIAATKTHMTAAAAAVAAAASSAMRSGSGGVGGANDGAAYSGRRSSDMDSLVNGTSSMFLRRSEERRAVRKI